MPLSKIDSDSLNTPITAADLAYTGTLTGGTGIVNIGSGQVYKDASGNVGIGTTSPNYLATLYKASLPILQLANSTSGSTSADGLLIYLNGANATISNEESGSLNFQTSGTERARITSAGDLVVGKTATGIGTQGFGAYSTGEIEANAGSNPAAYFNRTNAGTIMQFRLAGTTVGTISISTGATAYNTSSDYRLKENIAPMTGALAKVAQLKPVTYKWKADGSDGEGFIAHELAEVCPHAVNGEKDAVETYTDEDGNEATRPVYQGIDTSFLVATLTAAIQEQQALITQLQADVAELKGRP